MIKQALTNAAREGCRQCTLATVNNTETGASLVRARLKGVIANYEDENVIRISITPDFETGIESGTEIEVSIEITCKDVSWFASGPFANVTIRGLAIMSRE